MTGSAGGLLSVLALVIALLALMVVGAFFLFGRGGKKR